MLRCGSSNYSSSAVATSRSIVMEAAAHEQVIGKTALSATASLVVDLWGLSLRGSLRASSMRRVCIPKELLNLVPSARHDNRRSKQQPKSVCYTLRSSSEHSDRRERNVAKPFCDRCKLTSVDLCPSRCSKSRRNSLNPSIVISSSPVSSTHPSSDTLVAGNTVSMSRNSSLNGSRELRSLANSMMNAQERKLVKFAIREFRQDRTLKNMYNLCRDIFACIELRQGDSSAQIRSKKFKFLALLRYSLPASFRRDFDDLCLLYAPDYQPPINNDDEEVEAGTTLHRARSMPNIFLDHVSIAKAPLRCSGSTRKRRVGVPRFSASNKDQINRK